jgi:hypothetical protein
MPVGQNCDVATHACVDCLTDPDCAVGTVCQNNVCVAGCSATQPCPSTQTCCTTSCKDTLYDIQNCGGCGQACPDLPNASELCYNGVCGLGACDPGWVDCDTTKPGCETSGTACTCTPGATQACYYGPPGTAGVGICKNGTQTCGSGGWEACLGQVMPAIAEICGNGLDDDCDGQTDEDADLDNDGYGTCAGDCCDQVGANCGNPALVNPGAFEVSGNGVDDDCDGTIDNAVPLCDSGLASSSGTALDYAKAIDLCQFTVENPSTPQQKKWGVINAQLLLANGSGTPNANSRSIRPGFGTLIVPKKGQNLAVLSTGHAADKNDTNPGFKAFQDGEDMKTTSPFPADWYQANGNKLPGAGGCPQPEAKQTIRMLKLRIRAPTNAQSFSAKLYFFSSDYPEYVCTIFNDFFVTLVDTFPALTTNPKDKNIAIYSTGTQNWPVGVNLLKAAPGLFKQCQNGSITLVNPKTTACAVKAGGTYSGCIGTNELSGTGFDTTGATTYSCGYAGMHGGGTSWLNMKGNVEPGDVMEVRFTIWDTQDHIFDSLVLLDDWEWSVQASTPA